MKRLLSALLALALPLAAASADTADTTLGTAITAVPYVIKKGASITSPRTSPTPAASGDMIQIEATDVVIQHERL